MNPKDVICSEPLIVPAGTEELDDTKPKAVICAEPLRTPDGKAFVVSTDTTQ